MDEEKEKRLQGHMERVDRELLAERIVLEAHKEHSSEDIQESLLRLEEKKNELEIRSLILSNEEFAKLDKEVKGYITQAVSFINEKGKAVSGIISKKYYSNEDKKTRVDKLEKEIADTRDKLAILRGNLHKLLSEGVDTSREEAKIVECDTNLNVLKMNIDRVLLQMKEIVSDKKLNLDFYLDKLKDLKTPSLNSVINPLDKKREWPKIWFIGEPRTWPEWKKHISAIGCTINWDVSKQDPKQVISGEKAKECLRKCGIKVNYETTELADLGIKQ
jgi:hypothetical protein